MVKKLKLVNLSDVRRFGDLDVRRFGCSANKCRPYRAIYQVNKINRKNNFSFLFFFVSLHINIIVTKTIKHTEYESLYRSQQRPFP